jgi:hypothetical protein
VDAATGMISAPHIKDIKSVEIDRELSNRDGSSPSPSPTGSQFRAKPAVMNYFLIK